LQQVEIRIKGHVDRDWSNWVLGPSTAYTDQGETVLTGTVRDHASLYALLSRLADMGLQLNSVVSGPKNSKNAQGPPARGP
jgi:hypothetical protein